MQLIQVLIPHHTCELAFNLCKYKHTGSSGQRPDAFLVYTNKGSGSSFPDTMMIHKVLKSDILTPRKETSQLLSGQNCRVEEDFFRLKSELTEIKKEITDHMDAIRSETHNVKSAFSNLEKGMSSWSNEKCSFQKTVAELKTELVDLKVKNEDIEARMQRCNVYVLGVAEDHGSRSTTSVSKLLKEVLQPDKKNPDGPLI